MGKEAKLGLALIALLLGVFGFMLYKRLKEAKAEETVVATAADAAPKDAAPAEKPKLSSGPLKPTVVKEASPASSTPSSTAASTPSARGASRYGDYSSPTSSETNPTSQDPFQATASTAASRYADRYGDASKQIYPQSASDTSESVATDTDDRAAQTTPPGSSGRPDPLARYENRTAGGMLTPTSDASAALLPASATTVQPADNTTVTPSAPVVQASDSPTSGEAASVGSENPLRPSTASEPPPTAGSRPFGPRSYDLYGTTPTTEDASQVTSSTNAGPGGSRVRFGQSAPAGRYEETAAGATPGETTASDTATNSVSATDSVPERRLVPVEPPSNRYDKTPTEATASRYGTATGETPASRYNASTPNTAISPTATEATTASSSRSGWSGTGGTTTRSSEAASSASATTRPASSTSAPLTAVTPKTPRTLPASKPRSGESFIVEPNDNFWSISQKVYGTGAYFKALQEHNKAQHPYPDRLRTGDTVATPTVETLVQKYPSLCPKPQHLPPAGRTTALTSQRGGGRVYVVEEGDTLFDIARFELGKATRWAEIYELNKELIGEDFNHLRPGTQLVLPEDHANDTFTRRPGTSIPR